LEKIEKRSTGIRPELDSGLLTIDLQGRINFLNRTAEKILNRSADGLKDVSVDTLFPKMSGVIGDILQKGTNLPFPGQYLARMKRILPGIPPAERSTR
jgi:PAS domain-containing protein